jgi:LacI family transcriptional regulator
MARQRRVAVMYRPDRLGFRERATLEGIARFAERAGWHLVLDPFAVHRPAPEWDGMIIPPRKGTGRPSERAPIPLVSVVWSKTPADLVRVVENRHRAGRLAARHLVERGYRTFAHLGFSRNMQSRLERRAFRRELDRLGRPMESVRTFKTLSTQRAWWDQVTAGIDRWLKRIKRPVGFLAARPGLARAIAGRALRMGLRVPEDVGIVSADNAPTLCTLPPALTSIHFDYAELGHRAAELLDRLIGGAEPPENAILIPPTLVPRRSTDRQATADPLVAQALWFIDSRRTEPLRPADVAAAMGLGQRTLLRRLRQAGRDSIRQEIIKARIEHAKLMLADGDEPLPAVAHECGFPSAPALRRAFKRHVGTPPSHWRRQARLQKQGADRPEEPLLRHTGRGTRRTPLHARRTPPSGDAGKGRQQGRS